MTKRVLLLALALTSILPAAPDTVDSAFAATAGQIFDESDFGGISSVLVQPDGKILFGSNEMATNVNGDLEIPLIRINPNGSVDNTFFADNESTGVGTGIIFQGQGWPEVHALGLQSDQKIIAAGVMTGVTDGTTTFTSRSIVRFHADGAIDDTLQTAGTSQWPIGGLNYIEEVAVQPDDKIICLGGFGGIFAPGFASNTPRFGIARLHADGSLDTGFDIDPLEFGVPGDAAFTRGWFRQAAIDRSGKIYVVGSFEWNNTFPAPSVPVFARLFPDGTRDTSFNPSTPDGLDNWSGLALQSDGKVIAMGGIGNPATSSHLARYNPDGSIDPTFSLDSGAGIINARPLELDPNGKILVAKLGASTYDSLIRLNSDGSLDNTFNASATWNSDGTRDPFFGNFTTGADGTIYAGSFFDHVEGVSTKKLVSFDGNTVADTISWASTNASIVESAGTLYLQVHRSGASTSAGSVDYSTSPGSATTADFTASSGTLSWGNTNGILQIPITLTDDSNTEGDETFTVTLSNASGAALSGSVTITVTLIDDETAPTITTHPASLSVKEGESASFSVSVSSPIPPSYQWLRDGVAIPDATSATYTIPAADESHEDDYSVTVSIPGFSKTSFVATLTIIPPVAVVDTTFTPAAGLTPTTLTVLSDGSLFTYEGDFINGYTLRKLDATGATDASFSPTIVPLSGFTNLNPSLFPLPSGQIFFTGFFDSIDGTSRPQAALLNADGSLDTNFNAEIPNNNAIGFSNGAAVSSTGDIYLHYRENGQAGGIHRRLLDGSVDPSFNTTIGSGINGSLRALIDLPDGSLLVSHITGSGNFTQGITRLNSDGSPFPGFKTIDGLSTNTNFALLDKNRFAIGGNGYVVIYDTLGNFFNSIGFTGNPTGITAHRNRLIITGITEYFATPLPGLARFEVGGALDLNFPGGSGPNANVTQIGFDGADRMIAIGGFTTWNGISKNKIARLLFETPEVGFLSATSQASETVSPHSVSVVRYGNTSSDLSVVVYGVGGTATNPDDYIFPEQTVLFWEAGDDTPISVNIPIIDDDTADGDLTFTLSLIEADTALIDSVTPSHTVTIKDDDSLPQITAQPQTTLALDDSEVIFSVTATSPTTLSYQWYFDGTAIPSATTDTYTIPSAAGANEGNYTVVITNDYGTATSTPASLTIIEPPAGVADGYTPTLNLSSTAWAVATAPDGGVYVGGDFANVNGDPTRDRLIKVNADGTLDTTFNPVIDDRVLEVVVQDDGKILVGGNFSNVAGATCRDLARFNSDGSSDVSFNTNIGDGSNGSVTGIDIMPDGKIIVAGSFSSWKGVNLSPYRDLIILNTDGTFDLTYQKSNRTPTLNDVKVLPNGDILAAYNTNSGSATKVHRFNTDRVIDPDFTFASGQQEVERISLAADGDYLFAGNQTLKVTPDGTTDTTFSASSTRHLLQQVNGKFISCGGSIARFLPDGSADPVFPSSNFNNTAYRMALRSDGKIWVVGAFTSYLGTNPATSASRLLLLEGDPIPLAITNHPESLIQDPGTSASFTVSAVGTTTLSYRWYRDGAPLSDDAVISGSTSATLTIDPIADANAGQYTCVVSNEAGSETSTEAQLVVLGVPEFLTQPTDATISAGTAAVFSTEVVGAGTLTYQWLRNGDPITDTGAFAGSNTNTLTVSPATVANSGTISLQVTNDQGMTLSDAVTLSVLANPAAIADSFTPPTLNAAVWTIHSLSGEAVLIGGEFTAISNGATSGNPYLAVVESDGTIRSLPDLSANGTVRVIREDSNGKFLIGGDFTQVNGVNRSRAARLNSDFSLDTSFDPGAGANFGSVYDIVEDANANIYVGGFFTSWNSVVTAPFFVRLSATGTLDQTFTPVVSSTIHRIIPLADGDVIVAGASANPDGNFGTSTDNYFYRLNNDGSFDPAFVGDVANQIASEVLLTSGEKIYVNSSNTAILNRFDLDGASDSSFSNSRFNGRILDVSEDSSGRLLAAGQFSEVDNETQTRIVRFNTDDSVDTLFNPGAGPNSDVTIITETEDQSIWIGGYFTEYNGIPATRLIRLQGDATGTTDPYEEFLTNANLPEDQRGENDDPDGDRRPTLMEYLYGTDPVTPDGPGYRHNPVNGTASGDWINGEKPGAGLDPAKNYRVAYYNIPKDSKGLNISVQAGLNLSSLDDGSAQAIEFGTPVDMGDYETRSFYIIPSATDEPRIFWRLHITRP